MNWLDQKVEDYYTWLKSKTYTLPNGDSNSGFISTPFLGLFNDTLEIFVEETSDKIILSDDGKTLRDLELVGVPISNSLPRKEMLQKVLLNYGVWEIDGELRVEAIEANYPQKKHNLLQAMLEISDFSMLSKSTVPTLFKDDVRAHLEELEIIYTPEFISRGNVGIEFTFDFQIAYAEKEIVMKCFNSMQRANIASFLFMWQDVRKTRKDLTGKEFSGLVMINDRDKAPRQEYCEALKKGGTAYTLWGERNSPENIVKLKEAA